MIMARETIQLNHLNSHKINAILCFVEARQYKSQFAPLIVTKLSLRMVKTLIINIYDELRRKTETKKSGVLHY